MSNILTIRILFKLLVFSCIGLLYGCGSQSEDYSDYFSEQQVSIERPTDVWVFRSVLDSRIRMLNIGLHDQLWVAYSTENGALYKAWDGQMELAGPVYGGGGQPTTEGNTFWKEPDENPWIVIENGEENKPRFNYAGHTILDDRVSLEYELVYEEHNIKVVEHPEYYELPGDRIGFKRVFEVSNMPEGFEVGLHMNLNSITSKDDFQTDGSFVTARQENETISGNTFKLISGTLLLNPNTATDFSIALKPKPVEEEVVEEQTYEEITVGMIETYGCNTCHSQTEEALGPSFQSVAQRYKNTAENHTMLVSKVIDGGSGNWGEVAMIPHPQIPQTDVKRLVTYIMELDAAQENELAELMPKTRYSFHYQERKGPPVEANVENRGVAVNIYQLNYPLYGFPQITNDMVPQKSGVANILHAYESDFETSFETFESNFAIRVKGFLNIGEDSDIDFRLVSNDGTRMFIDGKKVIETVGNWIDVVAEETVFLESGKHPFIYEYYDRGGDKKLSLQWRQEGETEYSAVPPEIFTYESSDVKEAKLLTEVRPPEKDPAPGDKAPLSDVHPSFDVSQARPENFQPKIAGMDFMSDGRLVVSTWDSLGAVYVLEGVQNDSSDSIQVKRVASGLAEPLGLNVVDDEIYVLQKQELTKLVDLDNDGITDEYRNVNNSWTTTDNYHEFAFGLLYREGYFYGALSVAVEGPGPSAPNQASDRGKVFKISKNDGSISFIADGLRTPNGIGFGVDNEIFIADNQGDWLPANKILHLQEGAFYGNMAVVDSSGKDVTEVPPTVYLEHDKIGNSPSQPARLNVGPYQNQMIHGDVTHGGIKRVFAEKVDGSYQGAVFRFSQGLEAGVNRLVWGEDGVLYIGGIGNGGNWGQYGKLRYGLQKLMYNGESTFEMLAVRAKPTGVEIEFTEPLKEGVGTEASDYSIKQWWYQPTANYGGPNLDEQELDIENIRISPDRRRVTLELAEMKEGHVIYIRLNRDTMISANDKELWTTEAWYTMNAIPQ